MKKESLKENLANGYKCLHKHMMKVVVMIFIIGIILIFKDWFNSIFTAYLIDPIFSKIPDHSSLVGLWVFVLSVGFYYWLCYRVKDEIEILKKRHIIEGGIFIFYLAYRLYYGSNSHVDRIIFHSVFQDCWFSYIDEVWFCVFVLEVYLAAIFFVRRHHNKPAKVNSNNKLHPFLTDSPTLKDDFDRKEYAAVLLNKIHETCSEIAKNRKVSSSKCMDADENCKETDGAFVINISEKYGYGKSSFFLLLKKKAQVEIKNNTLILFEFKPWLCDSPQKIVSEFFKILGENLSKFIPDINKKINKYVCLLLEYYSSKNVFSYLVNNHFKEQSSILKEYELLKKSVGILNRPIVILIDDVDRLHDDELMVLFSLLRNTADFPNVYYIMAADVDYVKQVLKSKNIEDPDSYVKKFINVELLLPGYDEDKMESLLMEMLQNVLRCYIKSNKLQEVQNSIESIFRKKDKWSQVFTNIRDMKRFLNVYSLAIDFYINNNKARPGFNLCDDIDLANLFAIELVKYLSEPIYRVLRDRDDLMLNLSGVRYNLNKDSEKIVSIIHKDPDLEAGVKSLLAKQNKSLPESDKEKNITSADVDLSELIVINKIKSDKESIYSLLNFLFPKDSSNKLELNSLCHKDAYFRYFSYRFKKDQMIVNEVSLLFLESDIETYKKGIEDVFEKNKQQSFIHKVKYIDNTGSLDTDVIEKLFLFVDEASTHINQEFREVDDIEAKKEELVCEEYNVFERLFYWYEKRNYEGKKDVKDLKINMSAFINKDPHLNLLFLFLKDMVNYNEKERLVFTNAELYDWCNHLLYRFFKEKPSNEESKKELKNMLSRSMYVKPIDVKWLASLVQPIKNHYTWNDKYIEYLFQTKSELINFLPVFESPEIKDLKELLELNEISSCTVEGHPFLEMCKELGGRKR